jgi:hypothetical protein
MFATLRKKMATFNLILNPLTLVLDFESVYHLASNTFRTPVSKDATFTSLKQFGAK